MFKAINHFISGCYGGKLLWNGSVAIVAKENKEYPVLKRKWKVYECKECRQPFIERGEIEKAAEGRWEK